MKEVGGLILGATFFLIAFYLILNSEEAINAAFKASVAAGTQGIGALQGR